MNKSGCKKGRKYEIEVTESFVAIYKGNGSFEDAFGVRYNPSVIFVKEIRP